MRCGRISCTPFGQSVDRLVLPVLSSRSSRSRVAPIRGFSVFNGVVLKTLPVRDPHRLVVRTPTSQRVTGTQIIYKATLDALHDSQRVFSAWISAVFAGVAILLSCT